MRNPSHWQRAVDRGSHGCKGVNRLRSDSNWPSYTHFTSSHRTHGQKPHPITSHLSLVVCRPNITVFAEKVQPARSLLPLIRRCLGLYVWSPHPARPVLNLKPGVSHKPMNLIPMIADENGSALFKLGPPTSGLRVSLNLTCFSSL